MAAVRQKQHRWRNIKGFIFDLKEFIMKSFTQQK
jgi:hypothetical protein